MTIKVRVGGATREITSFKVKVAGTLRTVRTVKVQSGGVLRTVYSSAGDMSAAASAPTVYGSADTARVDSDQVTVTPTGGVGPYTYSWARTSGSGLILTPSFATTSFYINGLTPGQLVSGVFQCTVTDSLGATATASVTAELQRTES